MSVTILEGLQNAKINLIDNRGVGVAGMLGRQQLTNCIALLEKGYDPHDNFDEIMEGHESIDAVPDKP